MENKQTYFSHYPTGYSHDLNIPNLSLQDMLHETVKRFGDHPATNFYGHKMTYAELQKAVFGFASGLQQIGIEKGDRVAIMLPNCPQYAIVYYGILQAGAIVTQINPMLVERELSYILKDSGSKAMIIFDALYPKLQSIRKETNIESAITVSLQAEFTPQNPDCTFPQFLTLSQSYTPIEIQPKEDLAVLQYTGGTTGRSKGAMLTHFNILANVVQSHEIFKNDIKDGHEKCLSVIPLFHVFGMTSCMNLSIYSGNEMILLPRFDLEEVLAVIKKEQPTIFPGVPTMYVAITNHPQAENYNISSIRICNSGSAPMPVELMNEFERKTGAKVLEGYGLSEASPVTHCNNPFTERKAGTVGMALPGTECRVVDLGAGTEDVEPGQLGEVIIRGPQVMKGYWHQPEETEVTLKEGWLYTGDIGSLDEDGYLSIVDRKKDMIIAGGFNIYPRDVEEILYEHPAVQEAVVIGIPDEYRGETVKAVLVLKAGKEADEEEIITYCREHMSAYKVPTVVEFRQELPKTSVGKILRRALREESAPTAK
ncbi:long-chain acyl-CoA synthetase [Bacillus ectoiniformans]|uniref:long-chain-fatty-acid--CoA ligase n=1 Tax=Bacillus ectoiniformans TaxID=1494429 RepID=UPI00195B4A4E|nr:long-chain fatty acid--CoA ligase [Bacillus ectoiniformans]MBM7647703.1 long-chain acyl-CoA synthetase [Bacillus ectoiniformans]